FTDHDTGPEEADVSTASGRGTVCDAFKHVNAFGGNIEATHQIGREPMRVTLLSARFGTFDTPAIDPLSPKRRQFGEFAVDSIAVKHFGHVQLPITKKQHPALNTLTITLSGRALRQQARSHPLLLLFKPWRMEASG